MFTEDQITAIVTAQLVALLWSEGDIFAENGEFTGNAWDELYAEDDATPELRAKLTKELSGDLPIQNALREYKERFGSDWTGQFGQDLALTRNHHGAGFWDHGLGEAGRVLTDWAESLSELHIFHGHDSIHPTTWAGMFHAE